MRSSVLRLALFSAAAAAFPTGFSLERSFERETSSLDEIYKAALKEGDVVTVWHGGDEKTQQDSLKQAFETRFPGITLNLTQLATDNFYIDSVILQRLHDFPRWKKQGALLNYAPLNFNKIYPEFRDNAATYMGLEIVAWSMIYNTLTTDSNPTGYTDFLKPEFKDKLVLTYSNDNDAVLFQFSLINTNYSATFTSFIGLNTFGPLNISFATEDQFVSWPQTGVILKDAPHPEGTKLLHNFMLSDEFISQGGVWSVRSDIAAPKGYSKIMEQHGTDDKLGTAQGQSPLNDDL
ncbi:ABC-type Fe3+ transport system [Paraphoma chrysanthemicola]|uniref:ABC-type Fe3+ transport system n=1 Tax=Paraphoma chrysanthemicola TaxID=798071 RepID=A0A8K0VYZ8_9PLEO|nr:ABC-type Fe3+ transport system [Paraphoma chrysanthemicola]